VSLWSNSALHVHCGLEGALALTRVGWRRRIGVAGRYGQPVGDKRWSAAVAGLEAALTEHPGLPLRVVLANRLVQYRVIPWRDKLGGDKEYRALAQLEFADAFGSLADGWTITLSDELPGQARIAAAIPSELLEAVQTTASMHRARLLTMKPALVVAAGLWPLVGTDDCQCLVVAETGLLCFAVRDARGWRWVRQTRVEVDWATRLPQLLSEEGSLARLDLKPDSTRVFAPEANRDDLAALQAQGFAGIEMAQGSDFPAGGDMKFLSAWCA
jgi:hypothetical protein